MNIIIKAKLSGLIKKFQTGGKPINRNLLMINSFLNEIPSYQEDSNLSLILDTYSNVPYSNYYNNKLGYRPDCSGTYCKIISDTLGVNLGLQSTISLNTDKRFTTIANNWQNIQTPLKGDMFILTPAKGKSVSITNGGTRNHGTPSHVLYAEGGEPIEINGVKFYAMFETTGKSNYGYSRRVYATFDPNARTIPLFLLKAFGLRDGRTISIYDGQDKNEFLSLRRLK